MLRGGAGQDFASRLPHCRSAVNGASASGAHATPDNKKRLSAMLSLFLLLVAGSGFEPETFGL